MTSKQLENLIKKMTKGQHLIERVADKIAITDTHRIIVVEQYNGGITPGDLLQRTLEQIHQNDEIFVGEKGIKLLKSIYKNDKKAIIYFEVAKGVIFCNCKYILDMISYSYNKDYACRLEYNNAAFDKKSGIYKSWINVRSDRKFYTLPINPAADYKNMTNFYNFNVLMESEVQ